MSAGDFGTDNPGGDPGSDTPSSRLDQLDPIPQRDPIEPIPGRPPLAQKAFASHPKHRAQRQPGPKAAQDAAPVDNLSILVYRMADPVRLAAASDVLRLILIGNNDHSDPDDFRVSPLTGAITYWD